MTTKAKSASGAANDTATGAHPRTPETLLRRVPRQERGHERVDKLLDAAAAVIAEVGVEATTTNAIAAQAKTSVGSLYQFFPNKTAIVEALAARYNAELRMLNEETMPVDASQIPLPDLLDRIIAPAFEFYLKNPAYRHVYHALHSPDRADPSCGEAELHKSVVARTEAMLASRSPDTPLDERHLQATVSVLASHALLSYAMAASPVMRDGIVTELKRLLVAYIREVTTTRPMMPPMGWADYTRF